MTNEIETNDPRSEMKIRGAIAQRAMQLSPEKALMLFVGDRPYMVSILCDEILERMGADPSESFRDIVEGVFDRELEKRSKETNAA